MPLRRTPRHPKPEDLEAYLCTYTPDFNGLDRDQVAHEKTCHEMLNLGWFQSGVSKRVTLTLEQAQAAGVASRNVPATTRVVDPNDDMPAEALVNVLSACTELYTAAGADPQGVKQLVNFAACTADGSLVDQVLSVEQPQAGVAGVPTACHP